MEHNKTYKKALSFQDLIVWQKAHAFVVAVYKYTMDFPKEERYGLTSQFRRCSVSVAANIAEGFKKRGPKDKKRFYNIAQGSLEESRYYVILANDLGYGDSSALWLLADEVGRLLTAFSRGV